MAVANVFQSTDLVEKILNHIHDIHQIAGARCIDKTFNEIGKCVYEKKQEPIHSKIEGYKLAIYNMMQDKINDTTFTDSRMRTREYEIAMIAMIFVLHDIYNLDWTSFLHMDMDDLWKHLIILDKYASEKYSFPTCIQTCKHFGGEEYLEDIIFLLSVYNPDKFDATELKRIAGMNGIPKFTPEYLEKSIDMLHVYNTDRFNVIELKRIARIKGIPKCNKMKRSKLVKLLNKS